MTNLTRGTAKKCKTSLLLMQNNIINANGKLGCIHLKKIRTGFWELADMQGDICSGINTFGILRFWWKKSVVIVHANPELYNDSRGLGVSVHSHLDTVPFAHTLVWSMKSPAVCPGVYQPFLTTVLLVGLSLQPPLFPSMLKTTEPLSPPSEGHTEKFLILQARGLQNEIPFRHSHRNIWCLSEIQSWVVRTSSQSCQMINYLKIKSSALKKKFYIPTTPVSNFK